MTYISKKKITLLKSVCVATFLTLFLGISQVSADNTHTTDLELDSTQYWSITDGNQVGLDITGDISIELWLKVETELAGSMAMVTKYTEAGGNGSYLLFWDNLKFAFYYSGDGTNVSTFATDQKTAGWAGNYHHLALTCDVSEKDCQFYIDGIATGTSLTSGTQTSIYNGTAPFLISTYNSGATAPFDGLVDDVRVWNDVRTAKEIASHYNCQIDSATTSLVSNWLFNNDGTDEHANSNDLTNNNSATFQSASLPYTGECYTVEEEEEATTTISIEETGCRGIACIYGTTEHYETSTTTPDWTRVHTFHIPALLIYFLCFLFSIIFGRIGLEFIIRWRNKKILK